MNKSIEKQLSPFLLKDVEFRLPTGKLYKKGTIKLINTKQFYIKITLQQDKALKVLELPYPFKMTIDNNSCTFDYSLSCLCQDNHDLFYKLKTSHPKNCSKLYDTCLFLTGV